mgnify:CR=1 FL=1
MLVHNLNNHRQLSFKLLLIMQELHEYFRIACVHYIISIHVIIQLINTGWVKKTDVFHIQIGLRLIAGITQSTCRYYCAKEEFHANFILNSFRSINW